MELHFLHSMLLLTNPTGCGKFCIDRCRVVVVSQNKFIICLLLHNHLLWLLLKNMIAVVFNNNSLIGAIGYRNSICGSVERRATMFKLELLILIGILHDCFKVCSCNAIRVDF